MTSIQGHVNDVSCGKMTSFQARPNDVIWSKVWGHPTPLFLANSRPPLKCAFVIAETHRWHVSATLAYDDEATKKASEWLSVEQDVDHAYDTNGVGADLDTMEQRALD